MRPNRLRLLRLRLSRSEAGGGGGGVNKIVYSSLSRKKLKENAYLALYRHAGIDNMKPFSLKWSFSFIPVYTGGNYWIIGSNRRWLKEGIPKTPLESKYIQTPHRKVFDKKNLGQKLNLIQFKSLI